MTEKNGNIKNSDVTFFKNKLKMFKTFQRSIRLRKQSLIANECLLILNFLQLSTLQLMMKISKSSCKHWYFNVSM